VGSTPTSFLPFGDMIVDVVMEDYEGRDGQFIPASTKSTPQCVNRKTDFVGVSGVSDYEPS
jgi:hypothetical protein